MAKFNLPNFDDLDFGDLTTKQRRAIDYLQNIGLRGLGGIGTTSISGEDIQSAAKLTENIPSPVETGYGPREFNPQIRYGQRYQQRSGITREETPFQGLTQSIAQGIASRDYTTPSRDFIDSFGRSEGGDGVAQDITAPESTPGEQAMLQNVLGDIGAQRLAQAGIYGIAGLLAGLPGNLALKLGIKGLIPPPVLALGILSNLVSTGLDTADLEGRRGMAGIDPHGATRDTSYSKQAMGQMEALGLNPVSYSMENPFSSPMLSPEQEMEQRSTFQALSDRLSVARGIFGQMPGQIMDSLSSPSDLGAISESMNQTFGDFTEAGNPLGGQVGDLESTFGDPMGVGSTGILGGSNRSDGGGGGSASVGSDAGHPSDHGGFAHGSRDMGFGGGGGNGSRGSGRSSGGRSGGGRAGRDASTSGRNDASGLGGGGFGGFGGSSGGGK